MKTLSCVYVGFSIDAIECIFSYFYEREYGIFRLIFVSLFDVFLVGVFLFGVFLFKVFLFSVFYFCVY